MKSTRTMSKTYLTLILTILAASWSHGQDERRTGLIVTTPMSWVSGTEELVCFKSRSTSPHLRAVITVTNAAEGAKNTEALEEKDVTLQPGKSQCVKIDVSDDWNTEKVLVQVSADDFDDNEVFSKNATIQIYRKNKMIFLQTDKPVYKPADTIRIRILTVLGPSMIPVEEPISSIYIEDPVRTRIMQWKDVNTTLGLGSAEMRLSSEPPLGRWTIHVTVGDQEKTLTFEVKEYVLPKYSVSITNDASVYAHGQDVKWKVCATYTYGEPVNGNATTYICTKPYPWSNERKQCVWHNNTQLVAGCYEFKAKMSDLQPSSQTRYYGGRNLDLYAEVAEKGTGVVFNDTSETTLQDHKYTIDFSGSPKNYKPGLDYHAKALLKDITGAPVAHKTVYLTYKTYGSMPVQPIYTSVDTDENGFFTYNVSAWFTSTLHNTSLTIEAALTNTSGVVTEWPHYSTSYTPSELGYPNSHTVNAWYSSSDTYLQITPLPENSLTCAIPKSVEFVIASKTPLPNSAEFHIQITSHGNLLTGIEATFEKVKHENVGDIHTYTYSVTLNSDEQDLDGSVNIVIFYIRDDGEIVADGITSSFVHCFKNKVSASFSDVKARPGHESSFSITADAKSLCSIVVVDKSIKLMGASYLTSAEVQDMLKTRYDLNKNENVFSHMSTSTCVQREGDYDSDLHPMPLGRVPRMIMYPGGGWSDYVDSQKPFEDTGLVTLTDLTIATRPCRRWHYRAYGASGRILAKGRSGPARQDVFDDVQFASAPLPMESNAVSVADSKPAPGPLHRNHFPETWMFDLKLIGDSGELKVPVTLPHTITEWIGNGYCINKDSGLGVSQPFSVTGFQSFFMSFTLPYSMIRGEEVAVPVSVFNYLDECLKVDLTVEESTAFSIVNNSYTGRVKVCGKQAEVHKFYLVPRQLGKINFTVRASSSVSAKKTGGSNSVYSREETDVQDMVTRELLVEAEGKPEEISKSAFVCGSAGDNWHFYLPEDVVQDSERSDVSVIGDVMGPALTGLETLLRVPTGCGEQNMLLFAPNIYVLQYLNKTKRLTSEIEAKALDHMRTGYQRELNYRRDDGSYSAFGKSDAEGSIWLTAFVIKSFAQAKPYMYIDDNDLKVSINWMVKSQLENGCFPQIGRVLHKEMMGGVQGDSGASLTAYILVALLEAGIDVQLPVIRNAIRCLDSHSVEDVYTLSVMAYAYSVLGENTPQKTTVMAKLQQKAINEGDAKHWESSPEMTHDDIHHSSPVNIEATSYVLLSILEGADLSIVPQATPIVRWLSAQRNSLGGFCSTQDTVLALQSLAEYAGLVHNDNIDLHIQVHTTGGVKFEFDVTPENSLLMQRHEGLATHSSVHYNVEGTGCALLQATVKYNRLSLQENIPPCFETTVSVKNVEETKQKCNQRTITICTRYNGTEDKSNMAIIAVKMVSGWSPVRDSVEKLKNKPNVNLKRYETEKNVVHLYFDEIDGRKKCLDIDVEQEQYVSDTKPAIVHVFDYYKPAALSYVQYEIESTCLMRKSRSTMLTAAEPLKQDKTGNKKDKPAGPAGNKAKGEKKGDKQEGKKQPKPKKNTNCAVCEERIDNAALEEFCDSPYVFKVRVGRGSTMKVTEISRSKSKPSKVPAVNSNIKYKLPKKNCPCDLVTDGAELLVATDKRPHQKNGSGDWILKLKKGVTVLKADGGVDCPVA